MIRSLALALLIPAAATVQAHASSGEEFCGEAIGIYLPTPQGTPAPNIELADFQSTSPDDPCARNIAHDELMKLHAAIKPLAAAAFADSPASFGVMVRYTLTPDAPATFEMQARDAPDSEKPRLTRFYHAAAALEDFHSSSGTVYVVVHYTVSPTGEAARPAED
ncbi:hypothetical protein [Stenotrophomonas sp.]|uniref:hypothetical protein n=1 Tax=Stenotrophomonas sp. TaxID=69392 RepID=UPI0028AF28E4|nr:hypothetical protein [Stenotrophomonas sp.]